MIPNLVTIGGLVDTSAVGEDPVGCREVGIDSPVLFENATEFANLSLAGAGCVRSTPEGALDLTPAPSDSSSALTPSPEESRRMTSSHGCVVTGGFSGEGGFYLRQTTLSIWRSARCDGWSRNGGGSLDVGL